MTNNIKYINKDFGQYREALINYTKNYFPETFKDFNESSPGMMFIELASFVGDVLSLYGDHQLQESFINLASERKNIYNLAQNYGYKPNNIIPAQVDVQVMQLVPAIFVGGEYKPNLDYAFHIKSGMQLSTNDGVKFYTVNSCNFSVNTPSDPTTISVYEISNTGEITYFILSKTVKAISGEIKTSEYIFTEPRRYDKIVIDDENVSRIVSVTDSDDQKWYEVDFLSQDLIQNDVINNDLATSSLYQFNDSVPYLLTYLKTDRRYITRVRRDNKYEIQFGSGLGLESDEEIVPNPFNVGLGIEYYRRFNEAMLDPVNFLNTKTYGAAPNNTTLTVNYLVSNGVTDNIGAETLKLIDNIEFYDMLPGLNQTTVDDLKFSNDRGIKVTNELPAYGGLNSKDLETIKFEAMANFAAQNRAVTKEDYLLRVYSMPNKYGAISKAFIENDFTNSNILNLYVLSYNQDGSFQIANPAMKHNLSNYLSNYRMLTDAVEIKDPYIIHIGIDFEIITRPSFNANEVLLKCIQRLKELFHNNNMQINAPIILSKIYTELDKLDGVQTVSKIDIYNQYEEAKGYSGNQYDINTATRSGIIYPSLDPSIFEIKFPDRDIKGKTINI